MKQKLLLISGNKSFIAALQITLQGEYFITVVDPSVEKLSFEKRTKSRLYEKILFIDTGEKEIHELFRLFLLRAPWFCNRTIFVTSLRQRNDQFYKEFQQVTVAFYGDIISSTPDVDSPCNKLLFTAKEKNKVAIESAGKRLFPVFFDDVIGAIKTMLSHEHDHTLFVFPEHEVTSLTLARMLQKIEPGIAIDVHAKEDRSSDDVVFPINGRYMVDFINFETKLRDMYAKMSAKTNQSFSASISQKEKKGSSLPSLLLGPSLALFAVFLFFPILAFFSLLGSFWALEHGKPNIAKGFALFARDAFFVSDQTIGSIFRTPYFSLGKDTAGGVVLFSDALSLFTQAAKGDALSHQELMYGLNLARRVAVIKQQIQTENGVPNAFKKELGGFGREEQLVTAVLDVLPEVAGFKGAQSYLVLFQNNTELRPGGGFIGSYGLLTLKNGRIDRFTIHDVYDADGQMRGHIDPPYALKKYMGVPHWFLRDSNFDVDFIRNAQAAAFFLEKETGEKVDGVIGVDASFVKNLLHSIGPIDLPDFQAKITAENFTFLTQEEIQSHFFPGSRKKKNFLNAVYQQAAAAVFEDKRMSYRELITLFTDAIDQKHLLIASFHPSIQEIFTANGFSSTLLEKRIGSENTLQDFIGISEANIGQNKANAYIVRKMYHTVDIQKYNRFSQLQIVYTNKSEEDSSFGGDYNNYLRIILPQDSVITNISIDEREMEFVMTGEQDARPQTTDAVEIDSAEELGRVIYGMYINVPKLTTRDIRFIYTTPQKANSNKDVSYDLLVLKQPGTEMDSYSLFLHYPSNFTVVKTNKKTKSSNNVLSFETALQEDVRLTANFIK